MKYITLFETSAAYNAATLDLPNVSLIKENMSVQYNPYVLETRIVATFDVTDTDNSTTLYSSYGGGDQFSAIEIDGVELSEVVNEYTFNTAGEHTVKYTLKDPTSIGNITFNSCEKLTSITIPNSVTSIGEEAFQYCSELTNVIIPDSITSIGDNAFESCIKLTSIIIPDSVISIGEQTFKDCSGLTSIVVSQNNTTYDSRNNCNAIIVTESNKLIFGCKNTIIPDSVTSIGEYAFYYCNNLTSVVIPDSLTSISNNAFEGCSGLTSIVVSQNNTKYDSRNNCNAIIETSSNKLILGCKNTIIPDSVTSIGNKAFFKCIGLTSVSIGNSVTSIGYLAFSDCAGLTNVTIGNSVTSIGESAFSSCLGLTNITCNATTAPTIASSTFMAVKKNGTLTVPAGSTGYDVWIGTGYFYLGMYNWTKVEQ